MQDFVHQPNCTKLMKRLTSARAFLSRSSAAAEEVAAAVPAGPAGVPALQHHLVPAQATQGAKSIK